MRNKKSETKLLVNENETHSIPEIIECICLLPIFFVDFKMLKIDMEEYFTSDHSATKRKHFPNPDLNNIVKAELPRFLYNGSLN